MSMSNGKRYDYRTDWEKYVSQPEENRFLSSDEEDLLKICDCIELKSKKLVRALRKTSGGIPIHYADGKIYVLKKGPHTSVEGESGSKKSRTVCRGGVVTSSLNGDSCIVTDPKGEICSDSKILWLLHELGIQVYVVDLRTFDKDGYNPLTYIFEYMKAGKQTKAMSSINKFKEMLKNTHEGADDPYWNGQGGDMIGFAMKNLLIALSQIPDGEQAFNLSSVKSFIRQDREQLKVMFDDIASREQLVNSVTGYNDILQLGADKTYSCIVSSANALLSEFASSDELLQMLSVSTFDIRTFYEKPSVLFLVFPDEHKTYQMLTGYIVDQLYQVLVETYGEKYQNKKEPLCSINFICDEVANLKINDLASKVSASRSRQIDWTLIFQSERQMAIYDAIRRCHNDVVTICTGMAASMGAFLLASGSRGKRMATPEAEIMIHQPLGGVQGQASEIELVAQHIIRTKNRLNKILADVSGKPIEVIARDIDRDYWLSAEEAKEYGLIDTILTENI